MFIFKHIYVYIYIYTCVNYIFVLIYTYMDVKFNNIVLQCFQLLHTHPQSSAAQIFISFFVYICRFHSIKFWVSARSIASVALCLH